MGYAQSLEVMYKNAESEFGETISVMRDGTRLGDLPAVPQAARQTTGSDEGVVIDASVREWRIRSQAIADAIGAGFRFEPLDLLIAADAEWQVGDPPTRPADNHDIAIIVTTNRMLRNDK